MAAPCYLTEKLQMACQTFQQLEHQLADPGLASDPDALKRLAQERARLEPVVTGFAHHQQLQREYDQAMDLLQQRDLDPDWRQLASEELKALQGALEASEQALRLALLPRDPRDERSVMLEIRAGAGGDE
ncbi:MAG: PCRF domain-containing protein, partial [Synechococcus sp. SB0663_bin_10]|nr:PCRF domain-containing protein [Synechococcus sp. SB0663_bin_10]